MVTQLNEAHQYIYQLTYYDSLTKLPNRRKLKDTFNTSLDDPNPTEKAIIHIDIDRFHTMNDLYKRDVGDRLLIELGKRLQNLFEDEEVVYRDGEDEFLVYIEDVAFSEITAIGSKIQEAINSPFRIDGRTFYITGSIGMSHYPQTGQEIVTLLHQAEMAMYKVKKYGKNNYRVFVPKDAEVIERGRQIERGLHEALKNEEMSLVYQPKVDMRTGKVTGVESLLRWDHPELGTVSPGEFIPIAEESGVIMDIGYWVIFEAIRQMSKWHEMGHKINVGVNISAVQFGDKFLVKRILDILNIFEVDPGYFIVEVTESVMLDLDHAEKIAEELHEHNIRIAIDDFGTGYSSLSLLNNMYIDMVKIDQSFTQSVPNNEKTVALVKSMIEMSKHMDFLLVAEGIEMAEQKQFLVDNNCYYGQGYYFSRPVNADEVTKYVEEKQIKKMADYI